MIRIENIFKTYQKTKVLDGVSLKLPKNKLIAFIGSNGAGKSTLLNIISRIISKDSGELYLEDINFKKISQNNLAKKLAILNQSNHLNIRITVEELVSFGRFPHSKGKLKTEDQEIINHAIKLLDLETYRNRYLDQLSGGQRQMAYIAMVIAQDSPYIFLDEPLNNLDMKHSVEIMKLLRKLVTDYHKTIILVIHDINFVSAYADYIYALKDGKIICEGTKDEIITDEVLEKIYGFKMNVCHINNQKFCMYYKRELNQS